MQRWFAACEDVLGKIRETQAPAIRQAAEVIAAALARGNALHYYDTGHLASEPIARAGGLMAINPISFSLSVNHPMPPSHRERIASAAAARAEEEVEFALNRCNLLAGDCLLVISNSGKTPIPVQMALGAQRRGLKVIALTSVAFSRKCHSEHSSGKRLFEVADIVIDNCGVPGDAILPMPGLDTNICPTSGVAGAYILWALHAEIVERLCSRGKKPHIWRSVNLDDGPEYNRRAAEEYQRVGL